MPNAENARGNTLARRFNSSSFLNAKSFFVDMRPCYSQVAQKREKANMSSCALLSPRMFCTCTFYATTTLN